jgi:hypothetical protein
MVKMHGLMRVCEQIRSTTCLCIVYHLRFAEMVKVFHHSISKENKGSKENKSILIFETISLDK